MDDKGKGKYKTWEEFMLEDVGKEKEFVELAMKHGLNTSYIRKTFEILKSHNELYSRVNSRLFHGDFGPKHLLIKDGIIVGVLDMENGGGGDIARDFAWWEYFHEKRFPIEWLMEGYANPEVMSPEFRTRINLCRLQLGITFLYYYDFTHNQNGINHAVKKLVEDVNRFG